MKRLLLVISVAIILIAFYFLSPWGTAPIGRLLSAQATKAQKALPLPPLYEEGEDALKHGDTEKARQLILRGKQEATDSDDYYRFVVLDAKYFFYTMQADSFRHVHDLLAQYLARQRQKNLKQQLLQVELDMQMGAYLTKMVGQMDSAQAYNLRALALTRQLPGTADNLLLLLTNIADTYKQMGRYDKSVDFFNQAIELGDSMGMSPATRITITTGIASAYSAMRSFEQSNRWWQMAARLQPEMTVAERFHYLNNRGNDLFLQQKYAESLGYFVQLDSLTAAEPDMTWGRMFCRCNLSAVYIKLGRNDEARPLLDQTEPFFAEQKQLIPLYYIATQRIELAISEGRLAEAERLSASSTTPEWMIPEQVVLRQEVLIRLYELTGQWQRLAEMLKTHSLLVDSIAGDNMQMRISEALMHYEHEKQLMTKQQQLEEKELSLRWTLTVLFASIILFALLFYISLQKNRAMKLKNSLMESQIMGLRMETVRNRITPHFIGNALSAEMLAQAEGREVDLDGIVELLHRGIELTGAETSTLSEELQFISFYCTIESRSIGPDFSYETRIDPEVNPDDVVLPTMSVQILVENAIKHGLKRRKAVAGKQRQVVVSARREGLSTLIEVTDNGVGLPANRPINERTGLLVLRQTFTLLNEQNRQKVAYGLEENASGEGCRAWLSLPDDYDYKLKTAADGRN